MPSPAAFGCGTRAWGRSRHPQKKSPLPTEIEGRGKGVRSRSKLKLSPLARNKRARQVGRGQIVRPAQRLRLPRAILLEIPTLMRLRHQIRRDVLSDEDGLQIIGEQNALRPCAGDEVHDPALEALIDEVAVARVWCR